MKLVPVALFVGEVTNAPPEARVRRRYRKKGLSSQVACSIEVRHGESFAVSSFRPQGRRTRFRMQLRVPLLAGVPDEEFALVIQPVHETRTADPEQSILAPIYAGPDRIIFEFTRAEVVWCARGGVTGVRLAAIDPATGHLGTRNRLSTLSQYAALIERCRGQLHGDALLFPPRQDLFRKASRIPSGVPQLEFGDDRQVPEASDRSE